MDHGGVYKNTKTGLKPVNFYQHNATQIIIHYYYYSLLLFIIFILSFSFSSHFNYSQLILSSSTLLESPIEIEQNMIGKLISNIQS